MSALVAFSRVVYSSLLPSYTELEGIRPSAYLRHAPAMQLGAHALTASFPNPINSSSYDLIPHTPV